MAEFVQTMNAWRRMCLSFKSCGDCPMMDGDGWAHILCSEGGIRSAQPEICEKVILEWAAKHPEPVYPTWGEWLESEGICFSRLKNYSRVDGISIPQVFEYQIDGETAFICGDKVNSHIPADIAEKLGIEPKEG